jgi:hypothetical protein
MNTRKRIIVEEEYQGIYYVSVKSPLIINDKVERVIELAVDITAEELQNKLKI